VEPLPPSKETQTLLDELVRELGEDVHNVERLRRAIQLLDPGLRPHAALVLALTGLTFDEGEAAQHWDVVRRQRAILSNTLGRKVPFRVALLDHLIRRNLRALHPDLIDLRLQASAGGREGTDPVSGLLTASALGSHLQREILRSKRFRTGFSYLLATIDRIEALPEEIGEANLRLLERDVGLLVSNCVRDIDPASRMGTGRFGVLMPETDRTGAYLAADRLRQRVSSHFAQRPFAGRQVPVTVSCGIACFPEDASFGGDILRRAEQALFHARSRGPDRIAVHYRERREYIRIELDPSRFRIDVVERGRRAPEAETENRPRNISPQGVLFESPRPLSVGQEVSVICSNLRDMDQVVLPARVLRVEEVDPGGEPPRYEVGLAFELTWEHQVQEILEFIDRFRAPDVR
jgi:diguanylate cyclase (GGDEF)-like protein